MGSAAIGLHFYPIWFAVMAFVLQSVQQQQDVEFGSVC
jgi:hypothetical protein